MSNLPKIVGVAAVVATGEGSGKSLATVDLVEAPW
jgi:hypothetical protein